MNDLLHIAAKELVRFLSVQLPLLADHWWEARVIDRLSFHQQRIAQERRLERLEQLDLAALLRVLDQNWFDLSEKLSLPREGRNWLKELQSIRNKWAHASIEEVPASEIYRDADTLCRFLKLIDAQQASVSAAEAARSSALAHMVSSDAGQGNSVAAPPNKWKRQDEMTSSTGGSDGALFRVGDLVVPRSDPGKMLPILEVISGNPEYRYTVFQDNGRRTYYESQLQAATSPTAERKLLHIRELHSRLTSLQILSPSTAVLFSLRLGRVAFVPYQYRPVLKLIRADRPRLLIADEVGVGKTIEAGLILKELQARMDISSVLVICPKTLVAERKWQVEMKRFDESFTALDGPLLRHCLQETHLDGEWPEQYAKAILPFSLFDSELVFGGQGKRKKQGLLALDPPPRFDLVIVDEAHHIRNPDTFQHHGVRYFCDNAEAVILLTATPVQLGDRDLFTLLNVLRPDLVIDDPSFRQMSEPNRYINAAITHCRQALAGWKDEARSCLDNAAQTEWGRLFLREAPSFQRIYDAFSEPELGDAERVRLIHELEGLYTFSDLINRTRRRDIGEFTTRKPETLTVEFTEDQRRLHSALLAVIERILARRHGNQNVKFMMTTIQRQAASCLYGLAPLLADMLNGKLNELEVMEAADSGESVNLGFVEQVRSDIEKLLNDAQNLDPRDPKADAFVKVLREKNALPNNKALVFSTFRHTLAYLAQRAVDAGVRYGLVHGNIKDADRADLRRRFALPRDDPDALDVLLSSEVGCEGLDFQFCDFLVNYDLPWNPMKIEQRIGRIDRYGQKSEAVVIVNFVTPDTVDAEIYHRCLERIGVFHHAVGGSEEILGALTKEIYDIAGSFNLTPVERARQLQQVADNRIRHIQEQEALETRQAELFGLNVPKQAWQQEIEEAKSFWLSPAAIQEAVTAYLSERTGGTTEHFLGDRPLKTLRLGQEARNQLLEDFRRLPGSREPVFRNWEKWLKGGKPTLQVTFDQAAAAENPDAVYLSVVHPLVRQAARYLEIDEPRYCVLNVAAENNLSRGEHAFALYRWFRRGGKPGQELVAVADDPEIEALLFDLLKNATDGDASLLPPQDTFDRLDTEHHAKWSRARADHAEESRLLIEHRIQSLTASHRARRKAIEDRISQATDPKIRLMRESELARANADFDRRIAELQQTMNAADILTSPVLFGVLAVS